MAIGWHRAGPKFEWHAAFDGGGFGVGADVDLGASFSVDWKPIPHFGLTAGYNLLYLKVASGLSKQGVSPRRVVNSGVLSGDEQALVHHPLRAGYRSARQADLKACATRAGCTYHHDVILRVALEAAAADLRS